MNMTLMHKQFLRISSGENQKNICDTSDRNDVVYYLVYVIL